MAALPGSGEVYLAVSVGANKTPAIVVDCAGACLILFCSHGGTMFRSQAWGGNPAALTVLWQWRSTQDSIESVLNRTITLRQAGRVEQAVSEYRAC